MVYGCRTLVIAVCVALLSGCPVVSEEAATTAPPPSVTPPPVKVASQPPSGAATPGSAKAPAVEAPILTPVAEGEVVQSDDLEVVIARLFSRKVLVGGVEMNWAEALALVKATKAAGGQVHLTIGAGPRHGIFRMLATDEDETVHVQGSSRASSWISQLFDFGGYTFSVKKILVSIAKVEAKTQAGNWITLADYGVNAPRVDLMTLHQGGYLQFGAFYMEPGTYTRARVKLRGDNRVVVDEGQGPEEKSLVVFPSSKQTIELVAPFTVSTQGLTSIRIDFNVKRSVFRFFGAYVLQPVFKVLGVDHGTTVSRKVVADDGAILAIQGDVSLLIPPGALADDTVVSLRPEYVLQPHKTNGLMTVGHEYVIEPTNLQLQIPATLSIGVNPSYEAAVGLVENSLSLHHYDAAQDQWIFAGNDFVDGSVAGSIDHFGRFVATGTVAVNDAPCGWVSDGSQLVNQKDGLDVSYFAAACRRQNECYAHGFKTYGKSGGACDDDLAADLLARCDDMLSLDGEGNGELAAVLYQACKTLAPRVHTEAVSRHAERYAGDVASTCNDYDSLGVSCTPAHCSLTATPATIPANIPTDINFSLAANGNIESIDFDGTTVYVGSSLPYMHSTQMIDVIDGGRILNADRLYTATVLSPGGISRCTLTVAAIQAPKPCVMTLTPAVVAPGGSATLFTAILPGYNTAYADIRTENVLTQVGLTPPDANGIRYFTTTVRPSASRTYHSRVVHSDGSASFCQAQITVQ